jgi:hypothetical protein
VVRTSAINFSRCSAVYCLRMPPCATGRRPSARWVRRSGYRETAPAQTCAWLGRNLLERLPAGLSLCNHDRPEFRPLRYSCHRARSIAELRPVTQGVHYGTVTMRPQLNGGTWAGRRV